MLNSCPQFCHSGPQLLFRCSCCKFTWEQETRSTLKGWTQRKTARLLLFHLCTLAATPKWSPNHLHYIPVSADIQSHQSRCKKSSTVSPSPQTLSLQLKSLNSIQARVSPYWTTFRHLQDLRTSTLQQQVTEAAKKTLHCQGITFGNKLQYF